MDPQSLGQSYRENLWSGFWLVLMGQREEIVPLTITAERVYG